MYTLIVSTHDGLLIDGTEPIPQLLNCIFRSDLIIAVSIIDDILLSAENKLAPRVAGLVVLAIQGHQGFVEVVAISKAAHLGEYLFFNPLPRDAFLRQVFLGYREVPFSVLLRQYSLVDFLRIIVHKERDACTQVHVIILL